jgi:arylformamidase
MTAFRRRSGKAEDAMAIDLEAEYNNRARVPEHMAIINQWAADAAAFRAARPAETGPRYGASERCRYDLFRPDEDRGGLVALFIHGGYWQALDRSFASHLAGGLVAHGMPVAVAGFDLCPDVSLATMIAQLRAAVITLMRETGRKVLVYGHSAGGHLAAALLATDWSSEAPGLPADLVPKAMSISGLFDLVPLVPTSVNIKLGLDAQEAARLSPASWPAPRGRAIDIVVGADESSEFCRQSGLLRDLWSREGVTVTHAELAGENHFTVLASLTAPDGVLTRRLMGLWAG